MKILILLTLMSSAAMAYPMVGDIAEYDISTEGEGKTILKKGKMTVEIVAFNPNDGYQYKTITTIDGETPKTEIDWVPEKNILSEDDVAKLLTECRDEEEGDNKTLDIPAGVFKTCVAVMVAGDGANMTWIGDVPFAVLKAATFILGTKETQHIILRSYRIGS